MEMALKGSFRKEIAMKLNPQQTTAFLEDVNNIGCDDLFVDELLDFSNDDVFVEDDIESKTQQQGEEEKIINSEQSSDFSSAKDEIFESMPTAELNFPADDLAELEWLSHFVEDSNSEYSPGYSILPENQQPKGLGVSRSIIPTAICFTTTVPAKARSKRVRTGGRAWALSSLSSTDSPASSPATSSSASSCMIINSGSISSLVSVEPVFHNKPPIKRQKKKSTLEGFTGGAIHQLPRRCNHCGVQKTPQWRTGPLGAKTLCNACGVRYKSGRLLPEYRPACSPTFSSELHSNHHRKVVAMRKEKEVNGQTETGLLVPPAVPQV